MNAALARPSQRPARKKTVLIVDEDTALRRGLAAILSPVGVDVLTAATVVAATSIARTKRIDVLVVGEHLAEAVGEALTPPEVVWVIADGGSGASIPATPRSGTTLVFPRDDASLDVLARNVAASLDLSQRLHRIHELARVHEELSGLGRVVFASRAMREAVQRVGALAHDFAPVLFLGELGTGRATLARHLVRVAEIDLVDVLDTRAADFAHALATALDTGEPGRAILVTGLEALALPEQERILRHFRSRPGAPRILATATADLRARFVAGEVLRELFLGFRLVELRPLRERPEDIALLARHFANRAASLAGLAPPRIASETLRFLRAEPLPGNAHDIETAIESAVALGSGSTIGAAHVDPARIVDVASDDPFAEAKARAVEAFETRYVAQQLERAKGNAALAARLSGLDRANFRRLLRRVDDVRPGRAPGKKQRKRP